MPRPAASAFILGDTDNEPIRHDVAWLRRQRCRFRAGQLQQILDQLVQLRRGLDDALQRAAIFPAPALATAQRDLGLAADHGQRRAQRMAYVGEHAAPVAVDAAQDVVALAQLARAFLHLALEVGAGALELGAPPFQLGHHPVEAHGQARELVAPEDAYPVIEPAAGDRPGALDQGVDRRLDAPARPQRSEQGADRGQRHHRDREHGEALCHAPRLGIRDSGLIGLVGDHLVDQGAEPSIDQRHLLADRLGRTVSAGPADRRDRLIEQAFETGDPGDLLLPRGLGIADEGELFEGQATQLPQHLVEALAACGQVLLIRGPPERDIVLELLQVPIRLQRQHQIGLHLIVSEQGALEPLLHLTRPQYRSSPIRIAGLSSPTNATISFVRSMGRSRFERRP
jgi:hypothetical protein